MLFLDSKYAYLVLTLPFLFVWGILYLLANKKARNHQLKRSIIGSFSGPVIELFYFADYWNPQSVLSFNIGPVAILLEDFLFAFAVVGIGSVAYEIICRKERTRKRELSTATKMLILIGTISATYGFIFFINKIGRINSIFATEIALVSLTIAALIKRRDLWAAAIFTSLFFTLMLFFIYSLGFIMINNAEQILKECWMLYGKNGGWRIWRIPITEIIWAAAYGFACPILFSAVSGVFFLKKEKA